MHSVKLLSPGLHVQAAKSQLALPTGHGSEPATLSLLTGESLGLPRSLPPSTCISLTLSYTHLWLETAEEGSVLPAGGADPASCGPSRCSPPSPSLQHLRSPGSSRWALVPGQGPQGRSGHGELGGRWGPTAPHGWGQYDGGWGRRDPRSGGKDGVLATWVDS